MTNTTTIKGEPKRAENQTHELPELLRPEEVAKALRITRWGVHGLCKSGVLKPVLLGKRIRRYRRQDVALLINR